MTRKSRIHIAIGAALAVSAFCAQAATMTLNNWTWGNGNVVNVSTPTYNGQAGGFSGTLSGSGIAGLDGPIQTYCVELTESFYFGGVYSDYNVVSAQSYFVGAPSGRADRLGRLLSYVVDNNLFGTTPAGKKDDLSTALQLAIWNIVYDADNTLSGGNFSDTTTFSSATLGGNGFSGANALLSASAAWNVSQSVYVLSSIGTPGHQDQIVWRGLTVPEPTSLALVALALGVTGATTRRRSA